MPIDENQLLQDITTRSFAPYVDYLPDAQRGLAVPQGKTLNVYEKMLTDATIQGAIGIKQHLILSQGWEIEGDGREADFVRDALSQMQGSVDTVLLDIMRQGFAYGMGVSEVVWAKAKEGKWRGYLYPTRIRPLSATQLKYKTTATGDLEAVIIGGKAWPLAKFLVYNHNPTPEAPLGVSDLVAVYAAWRLKTNSLNDFEKALWRQAGVSTAIIESIDAPIDGVTPDTSPEQRTIASKLADELRGNLTIYLPSGTEVRPFDFKLAPEGYELAQKIAGKEIMQAILGVTLLMDEGADSGSYALGKVHWDVMRGHVNALQRTIGESVMTEQLVRRLIEWNFGPMPDIPRFRINPMPDNDPEALAQAAAQLVMNGLADPAIIGPTILEQLGLPSAPVQEGALATTELQNKIGGPA